MRPYMSGQKAPLPPAQAGRPTPGHPPCMQFFQQPPPAGPLPTHQSRGSARIWWPAVAPGGPWRQPRCAGSAPPRRWPGSPARRWRLSRRRRPPLCRTAGRLQGGTVGSTGGKRQWQTTGGGRKSGIMQDQGGECEAACVQAGLPAKQPSATHYQLPSLPTTHQWAPRRR